VVAGKNSGNQNDLADMVSAMGQRALDGKRDRVWLSPNRNRLLEVGGGKAVKRIKQPVPPYAVNPFSEIQNKS
jgi:hypothetical protein